MVWNTPLAGLIMMATMWLPFIPVENSEMYTADDGDEYYEIVAWSCPLLDENGRCSDYENRPQLCRDYQPKQDKLCVEYMA